MPSSTLKLSIIIPAYNAGKTILNTIASFESSIHSQFEVVIVDDCSTDDTVDIISRYSVTHDHVKLIKLSSNSGPGVARDEGLKHAKGEFVLFFDSDDLMRRLAVDDAINYLEQHNLNVAVMRYAIKFGPNKIDIGMWERDTEIYSDGKKLFGSLINIYDFPRLLTITNYPWTKICRTQFVRENNIQFGSLRLHEDILPHWMVLIKAENIYVSDKVVCDYYLDDNGGNVTNNKTSLRLQCITAVENLYELLISDAHYKRFMGEFWLFLAYLLGWANEVINKNDKSELSKASSEIFLRLSFEELRQIKHVDKSAYDVICGFIVND
ncbi:glycosyltransferase [Enterobacteriaceae bacterium RIT691]|nr:glycosyltransferase [Enterobacteriaceae bacterium RIT691]